MKEKELQTPVEPSLQGQQSQSPGTGPDSDEPSVLLYLGLRGTQKMSYESITDVTRALQCDVWQQRVLALRQLEMLAPEVPVSIVLSALHDPQSAVRAAAVRVLGKLDEQDIPFTHLGELLQDDAWQVRTEVLSLFSCHPHAISLGPLISALGDKHEEVRAAAVNAIGAYGKYAPLAPIEAALHDFSWSVRESAVLALGRLQTAPSLRLLRKALQDSDSFVRASAQKTLQYVQHTVDEEAEMDVSVFSPSENVYIPYQSAATDMHLIDSNRKEHISVLSGEPLYRTPFGHNRSDALPKKRRWIDKFAHYTLVAIALLILLVSTLFLSRQINTQTLSSWQLETYAMDRISAATMLTWAARPSSSQDELALAYADAQGLIKVRNVEHKKLRAQYGPFKEVLALTWAQNALYSVVIDGASLRVYRDNVPLALSVPISTGMQPVATLSHDGQNLALALNAKDQQQSTFSIYETATGLHKKTYTTQPGKIIKINWSPHQQYIASISEKEQQKIELWDVTSQRSLIPDEPKPYLDQFVPVVDLAWAPDEKHLAYTTIDGVLHIIDRRTTKDDPTLFDPNLAMHSWQGSLAWSIDSKYIALTLESGKIQIRDAVTGTSISTYQGHSISILSLAWLPDYSITRIASLDTQGNLQVWGVR